jgi:hypothetical protein
MKIKHCPWCKQIPIYKKLIFEANYDHAGNKYQYLKRIPTEIIECNNTDCFVRPRLIRMNTNDALKIWNNQSKNSDVPCPLCSGYLDDFGITHYK